MNISHLEKPTSPDAKFFSHPLANNGYEIAKVWLTKENGKINSRNFENSQFYEGFLSALEHLSADSIISASKTNIRMINFPDVESIKQFISNHPKFFEAMKRFGYEYRIYQGHSLKQVDQENTSPGLEFKKYCPESQKNKKNISRKLISVLGKITVFKYLSKIIKTTF